MFSHYQAADFLMYIHILWNHYVPCQTDYSNPCLYITAAIGTWLVNIDCISYYSKLKLRRSTRSGMYWRLTLKNDWHLLTRKTK